MDGCWKSGGDKGAEKSRTFHSNRTDLLSKIVNSCCRSRQHPEGRYGNSHRAPSRCLVVWERGRKHIPHWPWWRPHLPGGPQTCTITQHAHTALHPMFPSGIRTGRESSQGPNWASPWLTRASSLVESSLARSRGNSPGTEQSAPTYRVLKISLKAWTHAEPLARANTVREALDGDPRSSPKLLHRFSTA